MVTGEVWGYDPGGVKAANGVAVLILEQGKLACAPITRSFGTVAEVTEFLDSRAEPPLAVGIDTLTVWNNGHAGWRPADLFLRETCPKVRNSVKSSNELRGAMCLNGAIVLRHLRQKWPELHVTEAHPGVLFYRLFKHPCGRRTPERWTQLLAHLGVNRPEDQPRPAHEFDAILGAYAAWQGLAGNWKIDLHASNDESVKQFRQQCGEDIPFDGPTHYWWPTFDDDPELMKGLDDPIEL